MSNQYGELGPDSGIASNGAQTSENTTDEYITVNYDNPSFQHLKNFGRTDEHLYESISRI